MLFPGRSPSVVYLLALLPTICARPGRAEYNFFSFAQEVSARHTRLVVGILGGLGNLYAAGFLPVAGYVKDTTGTFAPIFVLVGLLPFLGLGALILGWHGASEEAKPS